MSKQNLPVAWFQLIFYFRFFIFEKKIFMKFSQAILISIFTLFILSTASAQPDRWQQRAVYKMDIDFDVNTHRFNGLQNLVYINNSPDQLNRVFYHLYFNAFQPGSMMDVRSNTIADPDGRVSDRISNLKENEIGYQKVISLKQNGQPVRYEVVGTILEVTLNEPIAPHSSAVFEMEFESQVPLQIRRSGRNNREGIDYSMAQWYPKMCEYDYQGWHANPYIGREFYGIWGDFDVKITIDKNYVVAASGYLQNPNKIGHGYEDEGVDVKVTGDELTWHFVAPNVHDFLWAADPDYTHDKITRQDGTALHFFYQKNERTEENWAMLPKIMDRAFDWINKRYGAYPYKKYSFIQGGDGGMEYPMATLITGERSLGSLVGVSVHELMHSWYQMVLGSNESLYAWMDEGFTSFASNETMNFLREEKLIPGQVREFPQSGSYGGYINFSQSGFEEALSTHSDHFNTNSAYGVGSYNKGAVFLGQMEYIVGKEVFQKGLLNYFEQWKFKHPNANDVIRVFEKASGMELDWYKEYFVFTTKTIDYGIQEVKEEEDKTIVTLERVGLMPMPLDVQVTYQDDTKEVFNIALRIMRGNKSMDEPNVKYTVLEDWPWVNPSYSFEIPVAKATIKEIEIDPSRRLADVMRENNLFMNN